MGFTRFVEMGRVVLVNFGPDEGKLGMITDVIDQNRWMVYSPEFDLKEMTYKRLSLTDLKVKLQRGARVKTAEAAWSGADVESQWSNTSWAKKIASKKRKATMSDFERYKAICQEEVNYLLAVHESVIQKLRVT